MDLNGKIALVTGGASGIGRETSAVFARHGAKVAVADINADGAQETVAEIARSGGEAIAVNLDVTREESWEAGVSQVVDAFGGLDVLVNSAGVELLKSIAETSLEDFRWLTGINVDGVFLGIKYSLPAMQASGGGSIVNISSIAGLIGFPNQAAYCTSKGAVRLLTKAAAMEAAALKSNVRINSVHPGVIDTPMARDFISGLEPQQAEHRWQQLAALHPIGRMGEASDVASAILFLASDHSSFMTGAELVVDGGITAR